MQCFFCFLFFVFFQFCDAAQVFFFLSFFNFVMSLRWRRSSSTFSQIWRDSKYESRKSEVPFHIVGNCGDFWRVFFLFFSIFGDSKNREFATDHSFSKIFLAKWRRFVTTKIAAAKVVVVWYVVCYWRLLAVFRITNKFLRPRSHIHHGLSDSRVLQERRRRVFGVGFALHTASDSSEIRFHVVVSASGKCLKSSRLSEVFDQMQKWSELGNN